MSSQKALKTRPRLNPAVVVDSVRAGIQRGLFVPGQRLVEIDLMKRFNVSRACSREALRLLEAQGLVRLVKNQGAFVRHVTRKEVLDILDALDGLLLITIRKVAAMAHLPKVRHELKASLAATLRFQRKLSSTLPVLSYLEENNRLWNSLTGSIDNAILDETHGRLQAMLHRIRFTGLMVEERRSQWVAEHARILETILAGDARRAEVLLLESSEASRRALMALPDEAFGQSEPR